jgi:hypothetical protein
MVPAFSIQHVLGMNTENKKPSTTVRLGFETRTIFMSCPLSRHEAAWLQFQNFSIACFVLIRVFQSSVEQRGHMWPFSTFQSHINTNETCGLLQQMDTH